MRDGVELRVENRSFQFMATITTERLIIKSERGERKLEFKKHLTDMRRGIGQN